MRFSASAAALALMTAVCAGTAAQSTQPAEAAASSVVFVGAADADASWQQSKSVTVPTGAQAGDTLLMVFTHLTSVPWTGPSGLSGWQQVDSTSSDSLTSTLWTKTVAAGDLGATVQFDAPILAQGMLSVADYAGVDPSAAVVAAASSDGSPSTDHVSPVVTAASGDLVASYWATRSETALSWTAPTGTVTRDGVPGSQTALYSSVLADSGAPVSAGSYGGLTATTDAPSDAVSWTVALAPQGGTTPPPSSTSVSKLMVIWEENDTTSAYGSMPYLTSLASTFGKATNYSGLVHPSLGNYLAAVSGQGAATCGLRDPLPAACPQSGQTVFGQALAAGKSAGAYAENMTSSCQTTNTSLYAARHNPWTYFPGEASQCQQGDLPLGSASNGALLTDIATGTLPNVSTVSPNIIDDAHEGDLHKADAWLATWMPLIMAGADYQSGRLAVVITFDEGVGPNQTVPFVLVNRNVSHQVVSQPFDHYALCRMYDDVLGVPALNRAADAPGLAAAFGL